MADKKRCKFTGLDLYSFDCAIAVIIAHDFPGSRIFLLEVCCFFAACPEEKRNFLFQNYDETGYTSIGGGRYKTAVFGIASGLYVI